MIALVTGFEDSFLKVAWPKFSENHDFDLNLSHHKISILSFEFRLSLSFFAVDLKTLNFDWKIPEYFLL